MRGSLDHRDGVEVALCHMFPGHTQAAPDFGVRSADEEETTYETSYLLAGIEFEFDKR